MTDDDVEIIDQDELDEATALADTLIQQILAGASENSTHHLIDGGAPLWYQDSEGLSALHAAAFNEDAKLVQYLIEKGAVWNAVDDLGNTAGDVSLSLNDETCYRIIRDAGIRSEYLLSHLSSKGSQPDAPSTLILRDHDDTAAGSSDTFLSSRLKFTKDARGQEVCLVQAGEQEVGVMMGWERDIMQETVDKLCSSHPKLPSGLKVLNVGFGLGIVDTFFQSLPTRPSHHYIIEAHPDVVAHMRTNGWYEKSGVTIFEGRWQDVIESEEMLGLGGFDVVYTDTFSESYQDLHAFFEHLPDLLDGPDARFSFFNGLGATNALFYDVYTQLSELHLSNIGISISWSDVDLDVSLSDGDVAGADMKDDDRWGDTRVYFNQRFYRLPIGRMSILS